MKELRLTLALLLGLLGFASAFLSFGLEQWPPRANPLIPVALSLCIVALWLSRQSIRDFRNQRSRLNYMIAIGSMCIAVPALLLAILAPIAKWQGEHETENGIRARLYELRKEAEQERGRTPEEN